MNRHGRHPRFGDGQIFAPVKGSEALVAPSGCMCNAAKARRSLPYAKKIPGASRRLRPGKKVEDRLQLSPELVMLEDERTAAKSRV